MTACPPDEYLSAVLSGSAAPDGLTAFDSHLGGCPACQTRLAARSDSPRLAAWRAGDPGRPAEFPFLDPSDRPGCVGRVGRFHVEREVGRGGMGVVFRAWDDALRRPVALKVLRAGRDAPGGAARFAREAQAAARASHDHLLPVLSVEEAADGRAVLVMPFVDGPSLRDRLRADPDLTPREAAEVVRQVATGLAAAHAAGLVHRDVKPGNVLLDAADGRAKLTDFGLARPVESGDTLTLDGAVAGTPEYMAPEQGADARRAGPAADVYALGVTLYECLTGVVPFRGPPLAVLVRHRDEEPVPPRRLNARVPADLETVCLKCLEKDPSRRYPDAAALADDLARFLDGRPVLARPLGPVGRARRWVRRNPLPVAVVLVSLLGAAAAGAGWWRAWVKGNEADANAGAALARAAEAETARADAKAKAALADERAALALGAITTLVGKAQALADGGPGTLKLKKELGEAALADLRALAASTARIPGADRTTVQAHTKLGDALNLLGQTDEAVGEWERARALAETIAAAEPDNVDVRRLAAGAHCKLGFTHNRLGRRPAAAAHYEAALNVLEPLARDRPADVVTLQALAVALNGRADVARNAGDGPAARADTTRAAELTDRATALHPANPLLAETAFYTRSRLGYTSLLSFHDPADAVAHFRAGLTTATAQRARRPADAVWARYYRVALLDLSSGLQRAGDYAAAEAPVGEAIPLLEAAVAAEPENGQLQRDVGIGYCHLAWVRCGQERWADAETLLLRANTHFERVADKAKAPALVAADIPANWFLLTSISQRLGRHDEAADRFERWGKEMIRLTAAGGGNVAAVTAGVAQTRPIVTAARLVPAAVADPAVIAAQPPDVAKWLTVGRVSVLAWQGDLATARAEAAAHRARFPADAAALSTEAMVLGRSALLAADAAEKERFVAAGLDALFAGVAADPSTLDGLHLNPDFTPLRTHPTFASRLRVLRK